MSTNSTGPPRWGGTLFLGPRRIRSTKVSRCPCSTWLKPGMLLDWDPERRRVVGCQACDFTGQHPNPPDRMSYHPEYIFDF